MPPSQLKRLKSSLREQGITGSQKSNKQKKAAAASKDASARVQRNAALQQIRDSFNPFELRQPARPAKFESASNGPRKSYKEVLYRPGVTKSAGEDARRSTLLPEMQRRNKVGGLIDRRIGESDGSLTAEEKALRRFASEKSRRQGGNTFDLEASDDEQGGGLAMLTHGGRRILDDYEDGGDLDQGSDSDDGALLQKKRRRSESDEERDLDTADYEKDPGQPERKKTKTEVMKELIAKSKLHKYERQKVKEDDDDIRAELDADLQDVLGLLSGHKPVRPTKPAETGTHEQPSAVNPDRQALIDGLDRKKADQEYDIRLRQLAQDTRAQPSERTRTAEEKAEAEAQRLQRLEERRLKRMRGEPVSDHDESEDEAKELVDQPGSDKTLDNDEEVADEAAEFGFTTSQAQPRVKTSKDKVVLDEEDDFDVDEDLIASGSDGNLSDSSEDTGDESDGEGSATDPLQEEDDEFVRGILDGDSNQPPPGLEAADQLNGHHGKISFSYPCPRSHEEFLKVVAGNSVSDIPIIIQRIRALHHPSLAASNKESMAEFASALVDHIAYMGIEGQSLRVVEQLIRHVHSLSRTYANTIGDTFRRHLSGWIERGSPNPGDLAILIAIGSIYPTSDHFHQVVTPAITLMARHLALTEPSVQQKNTLSVGAYVTAMCLKYQAFSKRYIPEAVRYTLRVFELQSDLSKEDLRPHLDNVTKMANLWKDKTAFIEIFSPFVSQLERDPDHKKTLQHLKILLSQAQFRRKPLELHHHKPLPLRTVVPKFEDAFNPDKHYDPDKERSEAKRLQKEYKRERKGALRELRKDANFVAREQLKEKREKDAEYERKYRRLVAEVQGEEGHAAKEYEREKERRKKAR
ncbi:Nop14-like protein [Polychaeton citri CBS 116435]|uniref:Nop14-like protein n=1 Tax=Polychaeton citri CBS 116435 TaxID=1314669 RepID=A0A9P4QBC6_9PEZI|nr:Nop14-like protein [Polychaeton citri CBS 116435]